MWTAIVIGVSVWLVSGFFARVAYRAANAEPRDSADRRLFDGVGCVFALPALAGGLGAVVCLVWKLVAYVNGGTS